MGSSPPQSPDPEDDPSAAMMATMGFSSFGGQERPSKKRRFNPLADAVVTASTLGPAPSSLPPKPSAPSGRSATGANQLPVHPRGTGGAAGGNSDEIDLGLDDDDNEERPRKKVSTGVARDKDDLDSGNIDTSGPSALLNAEGGGGSGAGLPGAPAHPAVPPGSSDQQQQATQGPPPPQKKEVKRIRVVGKDGRIHEHRAGRVWLVDYYDPRTNENPWARDEAERGLAPVGSWLTIDQRPN